MKHHYPLLKAKDMIPREQITLLPEDELDPLTRAELANLRRGVTYKFVVVDTPENSR